MIISFSFICPLWSEILVWDRSHRNPYETRRIAYPGSVFRYSIAVRFFTRSVFLQDTKMTTSWLGGVEEAVVLETEGGAEAWDASEMDLLAEARQTSENLLTVSQLYSLVHYLIVNMICKFLRQY